MSINDEYIDEEYKKQYAINLRKIMSEQNKTQADVARDLRIPKTTLSSWMTGKRIPRRESERILCKYLKCDRSDLIKDCVSKPETDLLSDLIAFVERDDYSKQYVTNLRKIMTMQNKTQADISRELGIPKTTVSSWMTGKRLPKRENEYKLCSYLNCDRSDLIKNSSIIDSVKLRSDLIELAKKAKDKNVRIALYILKMLEQDN